MPFFLTALWSLRTLVSIKLIKIIFMDYLLRALLCLKNNKIWTIDFYLGIKYENLTLIKCNIKYNTLR